MPGLVGETDPNKLGVTYAALLPLMVKSIQELSAKLTTTEAKVKTSEAKITELETKNADLQSQFNTVMAILSNNNLS